MLALETGSYLRYAEKGARQSVLRVAHQELELIPQQRVLCEQRVIRAGPRLVLDPVPEVLEELFEVRLKRVLLLMGTCAYVRLDQAVHADEVGWAGGAPLVIIVYRRM